MSVAFGLFTTDGGVHAQNYLADLFKTSAVPIFWGTLNLLNNKHKNAKLRG